MPPSSPAAHKLQAANLKEAEKRAEEEIQRSVALTAGRRQQELWDAGDQALTSIVEALRRDLAKNAPEGAFRGVPGGGLLFGLGGSALKIESPMSVDALRATAKVAPFEVMCYTHIAVMTGSPHGRYKGRSHSLWYCDAVHPGEFRWYETAFMDTSGNSEPRDVRPFALKPSDDTRFALCPGLHTFQVARPFVAIDHGEEGEFIERWVDLLADARLGQLVHPSHLPEGEPKGSWRVGGC